MREHLPCRRFAQALAICWFGVNVAGVVGVAGLFARFYRGGVLLAAG